MFKKTDTIKPVSFILFQSSIITSTLNMSVFQQKRGFRSSTAHSLFDILLRVDTGSIRLEMSALVNRQLSDRSTALRTVLLDDGV